MACRSADLPSLIEEACAPYVAAARAGALSHQLAIQLARGEIFADAEALPPGVTITALCPLVRLHWCSSVSC